MNIEEGCQAIIVNSNAGNDGIIVTVGARLGKLDGWDEGVRWEVDVDLKSRRGFVHRHAAETRLKRINPPQELSSWEEIEKLTNWAPPIGVEA